MQHSAQETTGIDAMEIRVSEPLHAVARAPPRGAAGRARASPMSRRTSRCAWRRALAALVLGCLGLVTAQAQQMQVIELDFRMAQGLIPILEPLLEPGGVLTGTDDVLFVRPSPENLEQIRAAVATLDRAPRQLLITVGQGTVRDVDAARAEGAGAVG